MSRMAALWQHAVCVLPANSGNSQSKLIPDIGSNWSELATNLLLVVRSINKVTK